MKKTDKYKNRNNGVMRNIQFQLPVFDQKNNILCYKILREFTINMKDELVIVPSTKFKNGKVLKIENSFPLSDLSISFVSSKFADSDIPF